MATQRQLPQEPAPEYARGRQLAYRIFMDMIAAIDVRRVMLQKIRLEGEELEVGESLRCSVRRPPLVIAIGKAATRMAAVFDSILGGRIAGGVVVSPVEPAEKLSRFQFYSGGHPYPTAGSLKGAQAAMEMVTGLTASDLVIFLVSGGGSAAFEKPLDAAITQSDLVEFNRTLVTSSLPIEEINVLRKHLSAVKGGRLAFAAFPARQLTIYISDVPASMPSMAASGPSMPDESTCEQCYELAEQSGLISRFPVRIRQHFEQKSLEETPKPGHACFASSQYFCLLSNQEAVKAAKESATAVGFEAGIDSAERDGECREVADAALGAADRFAKSHAGRPVCLVVGGEVTCPVTGLGVGGRNSSFALYAARKIEGERRVVLSAATDGRDGNSPSCGAVADGNTVSRARALGLDPERFLAESDAYHFFRTLGDTIETGFTENNVRDVRLFMSF
jgi:glycerate 2-kinase